MKHSTSFDEIIESGDTPSCESIASFLDKAQQGFIEITITHPHTALYLRMNSEKQKRKLDNIFRIVTSVIPITNQTDVHRCFEFTASGQIHLHGYVQYEQLLHYPIGMVSDMAKSLLSNMPKKYNKFNTTNLHGEWLRYRSNQGVIQYRSLENTERIYTWKKYINKHQ